MKTIVLSMFVALSFVLVPTTPAEATRSVPFKQYRCADGKPRCGLQVRTCAIVKVTRHGTEKSCSPWRYVKNAKFVYKKKHVKNKCGQVVKKHAAKKPCANVGSPPKKR